MIKNEDGQLWIPRRSFDKKTLPGHLDGAVVGHVKSGETYREALIREGIEEINIDLSDFDIKVSWKINSFERQCFLLH